MTKLRAVVGGMGWPLAALLYGLLSVSAEAAASEASSPDGAGAADSGYRTDVACGQSGGDACLGAGEYFALQSHPRMLETRQKAKAAVPGPVEGPSIGLALAGGGTRAAQFAIGVLKGLHEGGVLTDVDFLSTVSGGGYAGYWFMAQRIQGAEPSDMFRDCVPTRYEATALALGYALPVCTADNVAGGGACFCPTEPAVASDDGSLVPNRSAVLLSQGRYADPFRFQNSLRGHTDLFVPSFSYANTRSDNRVLPAAIPPIVFQLAVSTTVDLVGDVLFDWNFNSSTSRQLYRNGIHRIYGLPPIDCASQLNLAPPWGRHDLERRCIAERPLVGDAIADRYSDDDLPKGVTFKTLSARWEQGGLPYWIINATTPVLNCPKADGGKACVVSEVLSDAQYPPHKAAFEFTPDYWGAGEFGYWNVQGDRRPFGDNVENVLEAVASSAAFFDPHQRSFMAGGLVNGLLQVGGFRWGYYIINPHVSEATRRLHRVLPFPFYLFHHWRETRQAVDIHLNDGGQSDNLGLYGLIRRRVPNIIIADHASEARPGNMEDICKLRKNLALPEFIQWNGQRWWHLQFDDLADLDKVCDERVIDPAQYPPTVPQTDQRYRYNVHAWKHPVVRGCAVELPWAPDRAGREAKRRELEGKTCGQLKTGLASETPAGERRHLNLFLIKPALDLTTFNRPPVDEGRVSYPRQRSEIELRGFLRANAREQDGIGILRFPNHTTINLTLDSSPWLFGAYRELAASAARTLRVRDGVLVVDKPSGPPMRPTADYLVDRQACRLTSDLIAGQADAKASDPSASPYNAGCLTDDDPIN